MEEIKSSPPKDARYWADYSAIFVHLLLVIIIPSVNPGEHWQSTPGVILIVMEFLTIFFHIQYSLMFLESEYALNFFKFHKNDSFFSESTNVLKWVEYAASATLGTLALYTSSETEYNPDIIMLLVGLAVSEQTVGFMLDEDFENTPLRLQVIQWLSAFFGQFAEFFVVGRAVYGSDNPNLSGYWSYVVCWSFFGVWALRNMIKRQNDMDDIPTAELGYSILSTLSKSLVFIFTGLHLRSN